MTGFGENMRNCGMFLQVNNQFDQRLFKTHAQINVLKRMEVLCKANDPATSEKQSPTTATSFSLKKSTLSLREPWRAITAKSKRDEDGRGWMR